MNPVSPQETAGFAQLPLSSLQLNDYNARRFEENMTPQRRARFEELVDSVRTIGVLEPLLVRPVDADKYEIIAGERRYRAALRVMNELLDAAGERIDYRIPCMVHEIDADQAFDLMVIENLQREDLSPFETATAFKAYLDRHGNSPAAVNDLALRTGIPTHAIRRQVRLLELPEQLLEAWKTDTISLSHIELFTRVGDPEQVLELFETCKRLKLTVRELADRICASTPDLERGFFDKSDCRACHYNSAIQSGLFADILQPGKCSCPACFEIKQGAFLDEHWSSSKLATLYGTNGYRFSHRLSQDFREPIMFEPAERCQDCDTCISILRLNGVVVSGYARTCVGPRICFEELYRSAPEASPAKPVEKPAEASEQSENENETAEIVNDKADTPAAPAKKTAAPAEPTGPVFVAHRGEKYREIFFKEALAGRINDLPADGPQLQRLLLTAITLSCMAVRDDMAARLGLDKFATGKDFPSKIFLIPAEDLPGELRAAALSWSIDTVTVPDVRQFISEQLGIDLASEWSISQNYLQSLDKSEIVRVGEEPGVEIWRDEKAVDYRQAKYKGKALRALKKEELIDIIMSSGTELQGLVPAEVLGKK